MVISSLYSGFGDSAAVGTSPIPLPRKWRHRARNNGESPFSQAFRMCGFSFVAIRYSVPVLLFENLVSTSTMFDELTPCRAGTHREPHHLGPHVHLVLRPPASQEPAHRHVTRNPHNRPLTNPFVPSRRNETCRTKLVCYALRDESLRRDLLERDPPTNAPSRICQGPIRIPPQPRRFVHQPCSPVPSY